MIIRHKLNFIIRRFPLQVHNLRLTNGTSNSLFWVFDESLHYYRVDSKNEPFEILEAYDE